MLEPDAFEKVVIGTASDVMSEVNLQVSKCEITPVAPAGPVAPILPGVLACIH